MTATATSTERGIQIVGMPTHTNSAQHTAVVEEFERLAAADTANGTAMTLTFPRQWNGEGIRAGWIRSAYLVAFAKLGARYILRSQLNIVREQIHNPTVGLMPRSVMVDFRLPPEERSLFLVKHPRSLQSVLVGMGRFAVFLPRLGLNPAFYEGLEARKRWPPRGQLHGQRAPWPTRPELHLDWVTPPPPASGRS